MHSSKSIRVTKLSFCQNDSPMSTSFWQKGQLGHSYTFLTMPILILSPVSNFGDQSLYWLFYVLETDNENLRRTEMFKKA